MPLSVTLPATFAEVLRAADPRDPLIGGWVCSGSPVAAEIMATAGFGWLLIDGEHSPYGLETLADLLRSTDAYPPTRVVRVPVNDTVLIKQYLDLGAQNLMVPMVDTAQEAEAAVQAMHYPPRGVRGVGSALARSSRWNRVQDYLRNASDHVSLTVQVESQQAVDNAHDIAATDGVDAVFIGPSDLAASMGRLGDQEHPDVVAAVKRTIEAVRQAGKPVGVNAFNPHQAQEYLSAGASFALVGADVQLLAQSSRALAEQFLDRS